MLDGGPRATHASKIPILDPVERPLLSSPARQPLVYLVNSCPPEGCSLLFSFFERY